jgi:hypothetical protein
MNEDVHLPCVDKLVFDTKVAAQAAATVAQYQRGVNLKVYRCKYCSLWHLSSA